MRNRTQCKTTVSTIVLFCCLAAGSWAQHIVQTEDGLHARYRGSSGGLLAFMMNWQEPIELKPIELDEPAESFFVTDIANSERSGPVLVKTIGKQDEPFIFEGQDDKVGIKIRSTIHGDYMAVRYKLEIEDLTGEDRALTVRYQLPVKAEEWLWWDDVAHSRLIEEGERYVRFDRESLGTYPHAYYPLGTISNADKTHALSMAVPLNPPTLARIGYDGAFFIEFDLGLSPAVEKSPGRAELSFMLYTSDPEWGFRGALKKYYDIFPLSFEKRVNREGLWLARMPTPALDNPEDFAVTFHQVSSVMPTPLHYDNDAGIYTFMYDEPGRLCFTMRQEKRPSVKEALEELEKAAADPEHPMHTNAELIERNASRRADGGYKVYIFSRGWRGHMIYFESNLDPEIIYDLETGDTRMDQWWARNKDTVMGVREGRHDGVYIDSSEAWTASIDYNREHFKYADIPLGFNPKTGQVGVMSGLSRYEYLEEVGDMLHSQGKLYMANFTPYRFSSYATLFDALGTEVWSEGAEWIEAALKRAETKEGKAKLIEYGETEKHLKSLKKHKKWSEKIAEKKAAGKPWHSLHPGNSWRREDLLYYRRAMCYQKPYNHLFKAHGKAMIYSAGTEMMGEYIDMSMFYGIYPSAPLAGFQQFEDIYALFKRAVPVCRAIGSARWEPITHASTDHPDVRVERFGYAPQGTLHFTLRNFGEEPREATLAIDAKSLKVPEKSGVYDAFTGAAQPFSRDENLLKFQVEIEPTETQVYKVVK